jgi:hypothetical protein
VAVVHSVTTPDLDMRTRPDADAAFDSAAPDSLAKAFGEHHLKVASRVPRFLRRCS